MALNRGGGGEDLGVRWRMKSSPNAKVGTVAKGNSKAEMFNNVLLFTTISDTQDKIRYVLVCCPRGCRLRTPPVVRPPIFYSCTAPLWRRPSFRARLLSGIDLLPLRRSSFRWAPPALAVAVGLGGSWWCLARPLHCTNADICWMHSLLDH